MMIIYVITVGWSTSSGLDSVSPLRVRHRAPINCREIGGRVLRSFSEGTHICIPVRIPLDHNPQQLRAVCRRMKDDLVERIGKTQ